MREAYDTFLQEVVEATAVENASDEYYRYVCIHCGETVRIAAKYSYSMVAHFRHCHGNNDVECEEYLGKYGTTERRRYYRKDKVEFYYDDHTKCFYFGIKYDETEIARCEAEGIKLKIKSNRSASPFFVQEISSKNFIPNEFKRILVESFSNVYYICDSLESTEKPYQFFRESYPVIFKVLGGDPSDFEAKMVRGGTLYTDTRYVIISIGNNIVQNRIKKTDNIEVERSFDFDSMNQHVWGAVFFVRKQTVEVERLFAAFGYGVDTAEEITLLWPPSYQNGDIEVVESSAVYVESSFALQPHGNANIDSKDILLFSGNISKLAINGHVKIKKKNAELEIIEAFEEPEYYEHITEICYVKTLTVPEENRYYLFSPVGVRLLEKGEKIILTPNSYICEYSSGLLARIWKAENILPLQGETLLNDILKHYKVEQPYFQIETESLSEIASKYLKRCEGSGMINSSVKKYIEGKKI